ncbi:uncharacterized protein SPPG_00923 [Spizellomyces punctatus DAOM BR117]|uniref:Uncharacterized protein n=1 Tax=Spizellomyces punctatus (strain DAOM BR117) TaxID=645134 RepID=A0A0L0HRD3_SPIPD|nr:uncharacterized protein SPPG_00923 [Spizellomyces punctatus DAOM BR117]KND03439.1 hypothetical protein SPPG_00923 [Spizellomyces punctatus DAOM BR117]|eukprot:XP_016611478.1 hypothetical protein SPPG_00923 [Spizellomyces punctatus DAOM BR117]
MARARPFPSSKTLTGSDDAVFDSVNVEDDVVVNTPNSIAPGLTLRRFTTAGRDALSHVKRGTVIFNTDTNRVEVWTGTLWWSAAGKIVKDILATAPITQVFDEPNETTTVGLAFDELTLKVDEDTGELYADFDGLVKGVTAQDPLEAQRTGDNIDLSLNIDELTLKVDDTTKVLYADFDGLVKQVSSSTPLETQRTGDNIAISLNIDDDTLKVDDATNELYADFGGLVKGVTANPPLDAVRAGDTIDISLDTDPATLFVDINNQLTVVRTANALDPPLQYYETTPGESSTTHVRLRSKTPFKVDQEQLALDLHKSLKVNDDGKLETNITNILKPLGALRSTSGLTELSALLPGDLLDLGFSTLTDLFTFLGDTDITVLRLMASNDFTQTNGQLEMKTHGNGRIPYFGVFNGLQSRPNFTYNETFNRLDLDDVQLASRFSFSPSQDNYAVTKGFLAQFIQAKQAGGIDVSAEVNGRRELSVRCAASLQIDSNNNVAVNPSPLVDGSTIRIVEDKIASGLNFQPINGLQVRSGTNNDIQLALQVEGALEMVEVNKIRDTRTFTRGLFENSDHEVLLDLYAEGGLVIETNSDTVTVKDILTASNGVTRVENEFRGAYSGSDGVAVDGDTIKGVYTGSNGVTVNGGNIEGSYTGTNGVTVSGSSIQGAYTGSSGVSVVGSNIQGSYTGTNGITVLGGVIQGYIPGPGITITGNVISATGVKTADDDDTEENNDEDVTEQADGSSNTVSVSGPAAAVAPISGGLLGPVSPAPGTGLVPALFGPAVAAAGWIAVFGYAHRRKQEEDENGAPVVDGEGNPVWETDGDGNYVLVPNSQVVIAASDYGDDTGGCTRLLFDTPPCASTNLDLIEAEQAVNFDYLRRYVSTKFPGLVTPYLQATTTALTNYVDTGLATKQPTGDYATNTALTSGLAGKQPLHVNLTSLSNTAPSLDVNTFTLGGTPLNSQRTFLVKNKSTGTGASSFIGFENDTALGSYLLFNSSTNTSGVGANGLRLRNDAGKIQIQSKGGKGLTIAETTGNMTLDGNIQSTQLLAISATNSYAEVALGDGTNMATLFKNGSARSADGGVNTLTLRNDTGTTRVQATGGKGMTIAPTTGNATFDGTIAATGTASAEGGKQLATREYVDTGLATKQAVGDYATNTALTNGLATRQPLNTNLTGLSGATPTLTGDLTVTGTVTAEGSKQVATQEYVDLAGDGVIVTLNPDYPLPLATRQYVDVAVATKQDAGDYATNSALTNGLATKQDAGDYATNTALANGLATKQPTGDYATNSALTSGLAGKQPLNTNLTNLSGATPTLPKLEVGAGDTSTFYGDVAFYGQVLLDGTDPLVGTDYVVTALATKQPLNTNLTSLSGANPSLPKLDVGSGSTSRFYGDVEFYGQMLQDGVDPLVALSYVDSSLAGKQPLNTNLTALSSTTPTLDVNFYTLGSTSVNGQRTFLVKNKSNGTSATTFIGFENDTAIGAYLLFNSSTNTGGAGTNGLMLQNGAGKIKIQSKGGKGLTIAETTGATVFDGNTQVISASNSYAEVALGDGTNFATLFKNGSARSADGGVNTLTLRNDTGNTRIQATGAKGLTIAATTGNISLDSTTASTSTSTGAFVVPGGVGVGGALYAGGNLYMSGTNIVATQAWVNSVNSGKIVKRVIGATDTTNGSGLFVNSSSSVFFAVPTTGLYTMTFKWLAVGTATGYITAHLAITSSSAGASDPTCVYSAVSPDYYRSFVNGSFQHLEFSESAKLDSTTTYNVKLVVSGTNTCAKSSADTNYEHIIEVTRCYYDDREL